MNNSPKNGMQRRNFLKLSAGFAAGLATSNVLSAKTADISIIPLGLCNHSLRALKWKATQFIEYAAKLKLDGVLLNSLNNFENLEPAHLKSLKKKADSHGIRFYIGAGSISKGSVQFSDTYGNPEQIVETGLRVAKAVGSPVVNVRIGNIDDRYSDGGIEARMEESAKVLKASRSRILDSGIKIGFENHAGDMRSEELLELIKAVGTDVCGVMLDPGNAVWALEDPMKQVQLLGKYTVCTSLRDYQVWPSEDGATFQWTALGAGLMDVRAYAGYLADLCPGVPIHVESISNEHRPIPFLTEKHMEAYPNLKAEDLTDFLKLMRRGRPIPIVKPADGEDPKVFEQNHQRFEFNQSIAYLRDVCGVGKKVSL
mgnify:CR=1 FL=1